MYMHICIYYINFTRLDFRQLRGTEIDLACLEPLRVVLQHGQLGEEPRQGAPGAQLLHLSAHRHHQLRQLLRHVARLVGLRVLPLDLVLLQAVP